MLAKACARVVVRKRAGMMRSVSMFSCASTSVRAMQMTDRIHATAPAPAPAYARGSAMQPATAAAAAVSRAGQHGARARPWRPSKLRLLVLDRELARRELVAVHGDAHRAARLAPLGAGVGEHPIQPSRPRPARLTAVEPGTTSARTPSATLRPRSTAAASRRSDRRELVQVPMNTTSTGVPAIGWPALELHVVAAPLVHAAWSRVGTGRRCACAMPGMRAVGDHRSHRAGVDTTRAS